MGGFIIVDSENGRRYVDVVYETREAAERERTSLLKYFPPDHEWCRRLRVVGRD